MWPKENTAFLVIHGSGPHQPFQALDSFVRGFWNWLQGDVDIADLQCEHKLKRRDGSIESYMSIAPPGKPSIDFFEYYWDPYMVRDITAGEVIDWLDEASAGARFFYRKVMPEAAECYRKLQIDLFKDGEFSSRGYRAILGPFRFLARAKFLFTPFYGYVTKNLDIWIGDIVKYTASDVRGSSYETRQKMLSGAVTELTSLLNDDYYGQVIVAGHSLGSVIAYDSLNQMNLDMNTTGGLSDSFSGKLRGLVTFGSPLDKTAFCFANRVLHLEALQSPGAPAGSKPGSMLLPQQGIMSHLYGFRARSMPATGDMKDIHDPVECKLDKVVWLNFHHLRDRISGHLDAYRGVRNIECKAKDKKAHSSYWNWSGMYENIAKEFLK